MNAHPVTQTPVSPLAPQGMLFALSALARQPRSYKSELEEDFLPPREQAMLARLT